MTDALAVAMRMLRAIEQHDADALAATYHDDAVQIEYPNRLNPNGGKSDRATLLERFRKGAAVLREQRYEVHHTMVSGAHVALECTWTGVLAIALGALKPGDAMRARFAIFLNFEDGKIVAQRNYDCFEPF